MSTSSMSTTLPLSVCVRVRTPLPQRAEQCWGRWRLRATHARDDRGECERRVNAGGLSRATISGAPLDPWATGMTRRAAPRYRSRAKRKGFGRSVICLQIASRASRGSLSISAGMSDDQERRQLAQEPHRPDPAQSGLQRRPLSPLTVLQSFVGVRFAARSTPRLLKRPQFECVKYMQNALY